MLHIDPATADLADLIDEFRRQTALAVPAAGRATAANLADRGRQRAAEAEAYTNVITGHLFQRGYGQAAKALIAERNAALKLVHFLGSDAETARRLAAANDYAAAVAAAEQLRDAAEDQRRAAEAAAEAELLANPPAPQPACPECTGPVVFDGGLWHCDQGGHGAWERDSLAWFDAFGREVQAVGR
jgi:hypothetical protein